MAQVPHADPGGICPLHRQPMELVCHNCPLWIQLRGVDPNTGQDTDKWNCSLAFLPMLLIEGTQQTRQAGAAIESFRNEMVQLNKDTVNANNYISDTTDNNSRHLRFNG